MAPAASAIPVTTLLWLVEDEAVLLLDVVEVVVLELSVELELAELLVPPSAIVVESRALLSVKSASTVLAIDPVLAFAVK